LVYVQISKSARQISSDMSTKSLMQLSASLCLIALQLLIVNPVSGRQLEPVASTLVERLTRDGLDREYLQDLFVRPEFRLVPQAVAKSLIRKEANLNYAQYLEKYAVDRTIAYLRAHRRSLERMEQHFGISAPVVVAILSVETSCGRYMGKFQTVNVLATQALSLQPTIYGRIYDLIPAKEKSKLTRERVRERLMEKSIRAYAELKAFLALFKEQDRDPLSVRGSMEGAIGLPQFLPSNINTYGFDGNGDGKIDLFEHEDAIASVASFLKAHKWNEEGTEQEKKQVIRLYNPSEYYADTILRLSQLLANYWP
jgi:membrane-bound lytic murein transglycosylase B